MTNVIPFVIPDNFHQWVVEWNFVTCRFFNLLNKQYLADIEEHLGVTISQTGTDMKVPMDEFDGKVVYGQKRKANGNKRLLHI